MNFKRGRAREELEINLIPLIDVLLVILIFLMVTTTYNRYSQLNVQLPQAQGGNSEPQKPDLVVVTISKDGVISLGGKAFSGTSQSELAAMLKQEAEIHPRLSLELAADTQTPHGRVVFVLDAARQAGIHQLGIFTQTGIYRP